MLPTELDIEIREAALIYCAQLRERWGDHIPARELKRFPFRGKTLFMSGQQGIFKPKELSDGPLSIRTVLDGPYHDEVLDGGDTLRYDFSNIAWMDDGLKRVADAMSPVIYLVQVKKQPSPEYMIISPAFITGWDDTRKSFDVSYAPTGELTSDVSSEPIGVDKEYGLQLVKSRFHQARFRKMVLQAYRDRCAVCELRVRPMLDGAHIIPDSESRGVANVNNGLSLCANHHRAYDRNILIVRGDYSISVNRDGLSSSDRATNESLLQFDGGQIWLPRNKSDWPDADNLEIMISG